MLRRRLRRLGVGADIGLTTLLQVLNAVAALAIQVVVVKNLSKEGAGVYFLAQAVLTIAASMADFGLAAVVYPRLAVVEGVETPAYRAGVLLRLATIALSWALTNIYLLGQGSRELTLAVNIGYVMIFFSTRLCGMRQFLEIVWRLKGRTYLYTALAALETAGTLAILILLAATGHLTVISIMVTFAVAGLPGFILNFWPIRDTFLRSRWFRAGLSRRYYRSIFLASLPIAVMGVFGQLFGQLDTFVIEHFMTLADVGRYNAATRLLNGGIVLPMALAVGLVPVVAQVYRGARSDVSISYVISLAVRILILADLGICAVCWVFSDQIMLIFGKQYLSEAYILRVYSITNGLVFLVILFDQFLLAAGRRRQSLSGAVFAFILGAILEVIAVRWFGMMGVLTAKILAVGSLIVFQLAVSRRDVRQAALDGFRRMLLPAGVLAAAVALSWPLESIVLRAVIVAAALGVGIIISGAVQPAEIRRLKELRVA